MTRDDFDLFVAKGRLLVPVTEADRREAARGFVYHGYSIGRAAQMAMVELKDDDGLLQMLARQRLAFTRADHSRLSGERSCLT